jgi:hypothetical protein
LRKTTIKIAKKIADMATKKAGFLFKKFI